MYNGIQMRYLRRGIIYLSFKLKSNFKKQSYFNTTVLNKIKVSMLIELSEFLCVTIVLFLRFISH